MKSVKSQVVIEFYLKDLRRKIHVLDDFVLSSVVYNNRS